MKNFAGDLISTLCAVRARSASRNVRSLTFSPSRVLRGLFLVLAGGLCQHSPAVGTAQDNRLPCTVLNLRLPTYVVSGKGPLSLSLDVAGAKEVLGPEESRQLVYRWQVSDGAIADGQGTPTITLDTGKFQGSGVSEVLVSVDVKGIPPYCERGLSRSLRINPECPSPPIFDAYSDLPPNAEESRLDAVANSLKADPKPVAYILAYAGQESCIWETEWRLDRAKKYLVEKGGIDSERVITVDGGFRQKFTIEIFLSARDTCGPLPLPTLRRDDVKVRGQCSDKYSLERSGAVRCRS